MNVVLIGFAGSGKTTFGMKLAESLQVPFLDTDELIGGKKLFPLLGEQAFREKETAVLNALVGQKNTIIATGGGSVLRKENRTLLGQMGKVVYLRASLETLISRSPKQRAFLAQGQSLQSALAKRLPFYEECAQHTIDTAQLSPDEIVRQLRGIYEQ